VGRPVFASKRQLTDALNKAGFASGNDGAARWINALTQRFGVSDDSENEFPDRPIIKSSGPRTAIIFTWRGIPADQEVS
jgi:hypothetical protein